MTNTVNKAESNNLVAMRVFYAGFMLTSIYFFLNKDLSSAVSQLGIAFIFDPFDGNVTWNDRPLFQKLWTLAHVTIFLISFIFMIFYAKA